MATVGTGHGMPRRTPEGSSAGRCRRRGLRRLNACARLRIHKAKVGKLSESMPGDARADARALLRVLQLVLLALALLGAAGRAWAQDAGPAALRAHFAALAAQPDAKLLDRPLYLRSTQAADRLQADVYDLMDVGYDDMRQALAQPGPWCDILILHLNVKYCHASRSGTQDRLDVAMGRKFDQPLADAYWLRFDYRVARADADYLDVALTAADGPLGTEDYLLRVQIVPFDEHRSLVHVNYAYGYGLAARLAMQAYLATLGRDKVGFSIVGRGADGQPLRVGGLRGVLERNTVRYSLAIEAYFEARAAPASQRLARRLADWFDATERYPRQLHEIDRDAYVAMKLREVRRARDASLAPAGP